MSLQNLPPGSPDKPEIHYPCQWEYKVIGVDRQSLTTAIDQACQGLAVELGYSHSSSKGKYHSMYARVTVPDEQTRKALFDKLKNDPAVVFVI